MKIISLVVPCFNEVSNINFFYNSCQKLIKPLHKKYKFEIIFVDDGSSDNTLKILVQLSKKDNQVKIIEFSRNFGKEAALTAGLQMSMGSAVIPIDADLQDPLLLIPKMIQFWESGYEVVLAKRIDRNEDSWAKRFTSSIFYRLHNAISSIKIPNNVGDFRLMDREVVKVLNGMKEQQRFMKGLFAWVGFKTITIDYKRPSRYQGRSKFSGWKLWNFAIEGITSFSSAPLRVWSYIGLFGAFLALIYGGLIIFKTLYYGVDVPGYASLLVAILFFGSLQLIGIGMLGEYLGRVYLESKNRPIYVIRKKYGFK
jgi:glycosyltransferase involved in cell wall biosynthesis